MSRNAMETVMGAVVLAVAGGFLAFAYQQSNMKTIDGYRLSASFSDITGVALGTDVRIGGLKVGVVEALALDPDTYQANVTLEIKEGVKLPKDSSASIASEGLLGGKFVKLEPGGADEMLSHGGRIDFTQSSVSLEELIGKFMFSGGGVEEDEKSEEKAPQEEKKNPFNLGF